MIIYPAIDLIGGTCVRLEKGDFTLKTEYFDDPIAQAREFAATGAKWLHMVDLDGAKAGMPRQAPLLRKIALANDLKIQAGGGIRQPEDVDVLLKAGINRVVVGSLAMKEPETFKNMMESFGTEQLVLALDVKTQAGQYFIAVSGWQKTSAVTLDQALEKFTAIGVKHILMTDISRDGMLQGPNIDLYKSVRDQYPDIALQASGGVGHIDHVSSAKETGVDGLIIGKALYEKRVSLEQALNIAGNDPC